MKATKTYSEKLLKRLEDQGRTKKWFCKKMGYKHKMQLWRRIKSDSFTDAEKNKIETVLSK